LPYERLPRISGADCLRALTRLGFAEVRQRGSHVTVRRTEPFAQVVVPMHRELDRGTLGSIVKQAGIDGETFIAALRE
jgi:predicted RNA binding protein YcfA (HicA-like mRNA interferase family)